MQKRQAIVPLFFIFLLLSLGTYFLFQQQPGNIIRSGLEFVTVPLQRGFVKLDTLMPGQKEDSQQAQERKEIAVYVKTTASEKEMQALRDQFQKTYPKTSDLLPATIISLRGFIPGQSEPEELVVDKGEVDGVVENAVVVYEDNIVGTIVQVSKRASLVRLLSHSQTSFTGKTVENEALGVVRGSGQGNIMIDNVLLSETLSENDIVVTKGDSEISGVGIAPNLVVGKIVSVQKEASELSQAAQIKSLVDVKKLTTVFILKQ